MKYIDVFRQESITLHCMVIIRCCGDGDTCNSILPTFCSLQEYHVTVYDQPVSIVMCLSDLKMTSKGPQRSNMWLSIQTITIHII